jgi:hypothetical protein
VARFHRSMISTGVGAPPEGQTASDERSVVAKFFAASMPA